MLNLAYTIRNGTLQDLDSIVAIEIACFEPHVAETDQTHKARLTIFAQGFLVLEIRNKVVGYISSEIWDTLKGRPISDHSFALNHNIKEMHIPSGSILYISSMAVLPQYRNMMFGFKLFQRLLSDTMSRHALTSCTLIVGSSWLAARKLYQDFGFTDVRTIKGFFQPDDGVIIYKDLTTQ